MAAVPARRASAVPSYIFGALGGLLFGYDLGVVAGALLYIKPEFHLDSVEVGPTILTKLGYKSSAAILANAGLGGLTVLVTIIMLVFVVDRVGRRTPLVLGAIGMAACMVLLGLTFLVAGFGSGGPAGWLAIIGLAGFKVCYSLSWGGMVWIMLGEMFPLRVRALAMGIATFANWTGNLLVGQFFPQLLGAGTGTVFFMFAGIAVLACLFAIRWIPETRARTLEQIEGDLVPSPIYDSVRTDA